MDPGLYPESRTPAERAEADRENFERDPEMLATLLKEGRMISVRTGSFTMT